MALKTVALVVALLGVCVMYTDIMAYLFFKEALIEHKRVVVCGASTGIGTTRLRAPSFRLTSAKERRLPILMLEATLR